MFERSDKQRILTIDVIGEHRILLGHTEQELVIVAKGLFVDNLDHERNQLTNGLLWTQR